ncbi:MAG: hypothetical protein CMC13_06355 [Flavobacteriaceae bacterium]|mgnify:FL=1|nr:hypothetical protein [Flavobacteriaceae bacterium]|tara:strand:- start:43161 stop:44351 length:1191 start_codon:yes stop_codon:yes gene_type:complete
MNPSASGWIPKYMALWQDAAALGTTSFSEVSYLVLQENGFLYGVSVAPLMFPLPTKILLTTDELTKTNLFHLLVTKYFVHAPNATPKEAITSILEFYHHIEKGKKGFFQQFARYSKTHAKLEGVLSVRLHESNSLLKRSFTSLLTYAFLYVDVLAYEHYLQKKTGTKKFINEYENLVLQTCFEALQSKQKKNKYDKLLIELFEATSSYTNTKKSEQFNLENATTMPIEQRRYILDLSCLAVWDDHTMDASEEHFLKNLCERLQLPDADLVASVQAIIMLTQNKSVRLKLFEYSHPVNQFYKQATKTVKTLIIRNKSRLLTELDESGELLLLLGKSTTRELSKEEKKKVRSQLLDICKTIPSLTIFLLPGGTLLLPLFIKLIPQLLPSAFDENRIEK